MAFPSQFDYASEKDFTERLLLPLLAHLGFSLIINYHGNNEFGKDLVVAEFDRFSHVRYHAIQVKYEPSVGLDDADSLVRDCRQAFSNVFRNTHTGESSLISTFYVVNGGSISDQAATHFFSSLRPSYGDNARLLDGKALVQLDRGATLIGVEPIRNTLLGLRLEILYNCKIAPYLAGMIKAEIEKEGPHPAERVRVETVPAFLRLPYPCLAGELDALETYWITATAINHMVDSVDTPLSTANFKQLRAESLQRFCEALKSQSDALLLAVEAQLAKLGPLTPM